MQHIRRAKAKHNSREIDDLDSFLSVHLAQGRDLVEVPANRIAFGCESITPDMLPLIDLTQAEIDAIVLGVPGGASNIQDIYPLAPLQEGKLLHHVRAKEGDPCLIWSQRSFADRAKLNAYVAAVNATIARHDILRTAVVWDGLPEPVQVVWRHAPVRVEEIPLNPADGDIAEQLKRRFSPRHYRLDVRQAPLLHLFVTHDPSRDRWVMMELFHHLSADNVATEGMQAEIAGHLAGRAATLPSPVPFRNFVGQARLGVSRSEHETFFRAMLQDVDEPTAPFGLDVQADCSGVCEASLPVESELARRLRSRARTLGVSAASLCHVAWALVVAATSGRRDAVFGTKVHSGVQAGEGADQAFGLYYINTLPVRVRLGETGVKQSVLETHRLLTELLHHQHASLALAQRCSGIPAPAPLFTAVFKYQSGAATAKKDPTDRSFEGIKPLGGEDRTDYPVALSVDDLGEVFTLEVQAATLLEPERLCAMMHRALEQLVGALENRPMQPVGQLDTLPPAERHRMLVEWNETAASYPEESCVHELFEEQVERNAAATAVVHEERSLSYGELNARANRLAHHLRSLGVGADDPVAICVERSPEMVVGLLAILKAGGAFVPLDPDYPSGRLSFMLADSAPMLVLTHKAARARLEAALDNPGRRAAVLDLEADAADWAAQSTGNPDAQAAGLTSNNLAYIIYTSGSTGTPKGVCVEHKGVVNLVSAENAAFDISTTSRILQFSSFSFDAFVFELAMILGRGACLFLGSKDAFARAGSIGDVVRYGITHAALTPAALVGAVHDIGLGALQTLVLGGEAFSWNLVKQWGRGRRLYNVYGPTECTVWACFYECDPDDVRSTFGPPIGRPISNVRVYLLDSRLEPVPQGVAGEIYIGGAGVARGYLNRSDLTAERFIANPFVAGDRLYKTGDLGRYLADGNIEFLGRNDFQVKIRGFRIELGEIEARLAECEGVSEVNVIAREDSPGDKRLVAYYVADTNIRPEVLRAHLLAILPEYMVPAAYVRLDRMPLTHNGKLDRKALPAPDSRAFAMDVYEAPAGPVEERLARIWAGVLGLDRIGRNANFFDIGGNSLLAVRMLIPIEAEFGHSLNLTSLFRAPSIATLGQLLQQVGSPISSPYVMSVQPEGTKPPLFAIGASAKYYNIARHLGNTQPVIGLEVFDSVKPLELKYSCLEDMAGDHVKVIREIQPQGPYAVIGWCAGGVLAFETAQQLVQMGHTVSFIGIIDAWAPAFIRRLGGRWLKAADFAYRCKRAYAEIRAGRSSAKSLMMKPFTSFRRAPHADVNPVSPLELEIINKFNLDLWTLVGAHEPRPFHGRVHVFVSRFRPAGWLGPPDYSLGWAQLATEGVEVVTFEGDHGALFDEPFAGHAAATIAAALEAPSAGNLSQAPSGPATVRPNGQFPPADPLVSIVIPAYNAEKDIAQAIRCAISQTYLEIEIIVVDDGSQDGTVQIAREILSSSFKGHWSVLDLSVNRGPSAARNVGVKQAKGEWIQFLDSDDAIAADKIETQMKYARTAGPDVSAIYSSWRHVYLEDHNFVPAGPVNTPRYEGKHPLMFCMYYASLHHGACLTRRSALERVQGFDETMRSYEDADLLVRLTKETGRFQFVASNGPSYLWRLYKEQAREGGENARYKLEDTAMNWVRVVKEAAGNQQIGDILSCPDDVIVWRQHCTSYARRLFESGAEAFNLFMDELRLVDPDFTYPQADGPGFARVA
jgi:amino acid adenylation domain-containing protein